MDYFESSLQHLLSELERIDLLIRAQVAQVRQIQSQDEQFRGLYISEQEIDALLARPIGVPHWFGAPMVAAQVESLCQEMSQDIERRKQASVKRGVSLRLQQLQQIFALDRFQTDILLIALAVELDLRYERMYAYLQDDVTKKRPSVDLVLNLLPVSVQAKIQARGHFSWSSPLLHNRLVELFEDPSIPNPPLLAKYLKVDSRIVQYLLGDDGLDERIEAFTVGHEPGQPLDELLVDQGVMRRLSGFIDSSVPGDRVIVHLRGPYGVGRLATAEALCRERQLPLLVADLERMTYQGDGGSDRAFCLVQREAKLRGAAVYWKNFDRLLHEQDQGLPLTFTESLDDRPELNFLAGQQPWQPVDALRDTPFARIKLARPAFAERLRIWSASLVGDDVSDRKLDVSALASKFKFTGGQIKDAAATAVNLARLRESDMAQLELSDLYEASRLHSNQKLSALARKIEPKHSWVDIVLPEDRLEQLREICNHVRYHDQVYGAWGFDRKFSYGKGLSVLFAGPSGTGKTMAAEIISGELGLELYKIDLSTVVSKYIGETEKNLSQIFSEAETSNAVLFFDEAEALFGKRSEVKDAHDRYANIETGYLLQRMEEYQGAVILATNLSKNMDEAFVRRLQFTVEFPFPDATDRRRIWERIWPADTPRDPALDLDFLARQFKLSGGNIRNIALAAAFLAADNGGVVATGHLLRATKRECQKMGQVITQGEFEQIVKAAAIASERAAAY